MLFVISWINLVVQAPVHAAMKQQAALSDHSSMMNCHCPETLCDTVLNLENQSTEVVHLTFEAIADFQIAYFSLIVNPHHQTMTSLDIKYLMSIFETNRPPPLVTTRILLI